MTQYFKDLGVSNSLLIILKKEGYVKPYPIQEKVIPHILNKKDILGIAKTGSGKTASYVLPILTNLAEKITNNKIIHKNRHIEVLILVPTRELAVQVGETLKIFTQKSKIKTLAIYGGVSINIQMKTLGNINILVATPGRLLNLIEVNSLHLSKVECLVIDEADKILNKGFTKEINQIINLLPKKRQNLLFSATLNENIESINKIILKNPTVINVSNDNEEISLIEQTVYLVSDERKGPLLRYIIKNNNIKQVLIFVSSIKKADRVTEKLKKNGIKAEAIHKKKSQGARVDILTRFKNKKLPVLVSTDLLSRGIDIESLPYIINYELPRSPKVFIHRVGRTGRAESTGKAISLITPEDQHHFKVIEKKMKVKVEKIETEDFNLHGY